jgi:hypothetical protein
MRRALGLVPLAALAIAAGPATAATTREVDLPKLFATALPKVAARTVVPVLLPQTLTWDATGRLYPSSVARAHRWRLDVAAAPRCHQATACFVAEFTGVRGGSVAGGRRVALRGGRTGHFHPGSCGASCSPPSIAFRRQGVAYSIQAQVLGSRSERRTLVRMADEAIRHGAR